jgi:hypothetical protein
VNQQVGGRLVEILTAAMDEYCAACADITDQIDHGRAATPEQLQRAMAATLRLENAQVLVELDVRRRLNAHRATPSRTIH